MLLPPERKRGSSVACEIGIRLEPLAIKEFCSRHNIKKSQGFVPPYVKVEVDFIPNNNNNNCKVEKVVIGGRGDYVFVQKEPLVNVPQALSQKLLEIKCLVTRKITKLVPIQYYLQVQTMLYVFQQLDVPITEAVYCENIFDDNQKLVEFWEHTITLDKEYFESKILPILGHYSQNLEKSIELGVPQKRARSPIGNNTNTLGGYGAVNTAAARSPTRSSTNFFSKRGRFNDKIQRLNFGKVFGHYLGQPAVFGPGSFTNFLDQNRLRDLFSLCLRRGKDDHFPSPHLETHDLKTRLQLTTAPQKVIKISENVMPVENNMIEPFGSYKFMPIGYLETMRSLNQHPDVIVGGQLYLPSECLWVNFDHLVKNSCLGEKFPNRYTPVIFIATKYNLDNKTSQRAKFLLYLQVRVLNFYFSGQQNYGIIIDSVNNITKLNFDQRIENKYKEGLEWLETATSTTNNSSKDPSTIALELAVRPNCKVKTRDLKFEEWKQQLASTTGELTQLWSINCQKRDKLVEHGIDSIDKLSKSINKQKIKNILGNTHGNLRSMLLANSSGKLVKLQAVRNELRSLQSDQELYLDFEFTPQLLYMIGYVHTSLNSHKEMCQHILDYPNNEDQERLSREFEDKIREISKSSKDIINCYHWGEVEERLVKKYMPNLHSMLNFIDVHSILLDLNFAIPNCNGYSIKNVGKALKTLGFIKTEWKESADGYWCNQTLSKLMTSSSPASKLKDLPNFQKIIEYNQTDCQVLYEIVNFLRGGAPPAAYAAP